ncbi:MAG: hypothetical protein IJD59_00065 [Clostridia bacterium]|nr:hypothetical protein [Clostridia bacterium]
MKTSCDIIKPSNVHVRKNIPKKGRKHMTENKSFVFYESVYAGLEGWPTGEKMQVIDAICRYGFYNEIPVGLDYHANGMFVIAKANIDAAKARYCASVENGKKGGRPRKDASKKTNTDSAEKPNENLNDNVNVNTNDNINDDANVHVDDITLRENPWDSGSAWDFSKKTDDDEATKAFLSFSDGKTVSVSRKELENWKAEFPGLDFSKEFHEMQQWLNENPENQKSSGYRRFISSWLKRSRKASESEQPFTREYEEFFQAACMPGTEILSF